MAYRAVLLAFVDGAGIRLLHSPCAGGVLLANIHGIEHAVLLQRIANIDFRRRNDGRNGEILDSNAVSGLTIALAVGILGGDDPNESYLRCRPVETTRIINSRGIFFGNERGIRIIRVCIWINNQIFTIIEIEIG